VLAAWCCLAGGCSSRPSALAELAPVTGTVRLDGKPLAAAVVRFEGAKGQMSFGRTDAEGRYEISFSRQFKGAPIGPAVVRITSGLDAPPPPGYRDPIPPKYNTDSKLSAEVGKGANVCDFDLVTSP